MSSRGPTKARRERMVRALELRQQGLSYRAIAADIKVSPKRAFEDVQDALKEITRETAEQTLTLELERLDELYLLAYARARRQNDMRALEAALRVSQQRSTLLRHTDPVTESGTAAVKTLLDRLLEGTPEA